MARDNKTVKRGVYLYIDGKEIKNDVNSIDLEIKRLSRDIKDMTRESDGYNKTAAKIRSLKAILKEHNTLLRTTGDNIRRNTNEAETSHGKLGKLADGFNKYFAMVSSFIAGITGVFLTMRKAVTDYLNLDSAYSDVMKYTGKTREEVVVLNEDLKKINTKTARVELNALVSDAGKLGIKGKQDLLDFAYAGDVMRVSLGEDLGKDAIKNIGKLAQMFGDADSMGLKNAMLAIGSSINDIAQSSSAAEPYLVEFTNRMAGIGKQADISIPKIIGYASVLDQNAQQIEMSSTALNGIMMKMFKDPAKLARIAGLEVKTFAKLVREDANEALLQLLQTLGQKGGMNQLAPIFDEMKLDGARASQVLSVLAGNVDKIRQQQQQATLAFKEGTSVIDEFNTKNNDLTAKMMKAKKVFQERIYQLGEQLLPIMTKLVSASSVTIRVMNDLITLGIKYGDVILFLTATLTAYYASVRVGNTLQAISNNLTKVATALKLAYGVAMCNLSGYTVTSYKNLKSLYILMQAHPATLKILRASTYLYAAAVQFLTGHWIKAAKAMKSAWAIMAFNPISLLTAAVAGATVVSYKLTQKVKDYYDLKKVLNSIEERTIILFDKESKKVEELKTKIHNNSLALADRKKAVEDLKSILPGYYAEISNEGKVVKENTDILNRMNETLKMNIELREISEELEKRRKNIKKLEKSPAFKDNSLLGSMAREDVRTKIADEQAVIDGLMSRYDMLSKKRNEESANDKDVRTLESVTKELNNAKKVLTDLEKTDTTFFNPGELIVYTSKLNAASFAVQKLSKEQEELKKKAKITSGGNSEAETEKEKAKRIKKELAAIDAEFLQKQADLKKKYMASDTMTQEEYAKEVEKLELDKLEKQLTIAELEPKKREEIANKILDYSIKLKEQLAELDKKSELDPEAQNKRELDAIRKKYDTMRSIVTKANEKFLISEENKNKILNDINEKQAYEEKKNREKEAELLLKQKDKSLTNEIYLLNERRISENMSEKKYKEELRDLNIKHLNELLKITGLSEEQITELQSKLQDIRLEKNRNNLEKTKEQQLQYVSIIEDVLSSFAEDTAAFFMDNEASLKGYLKSLLIMMLDTLEKIVNLTIVEVTIKSIKDGAIGWVVGALKIAAIKAAFAGARGIVNNFYDGGFTGHGSWNQPQGVVHSDEFVSNRFAVANPHLRPVFDLIDYAQRTGTVSNLTSNDIVAVSKNGTVSTAVTSKSISGQTDNPTVDYNAMMMLFGKLAKTMNNLNKRLDEPIFTYTKASGKYGVNEAQELIDKMNDNASRKN